MKRLDLVRSAQSKVVIGKRNADVLARAQRPQKVRDVQARAEVEVRLIESAVELEEVAAWPGFEIEISGHGSLCAQSERAERVTA